MKISQQMSIPSKVTASVETNLEITCDVRSKLDTGEAVDTGELRKSEMVDGLLATDDATCPHFR